MDGPLREEAEAVAQETDEVLELVEQLRDALHGGNQRSAERRPWLAPFVTGTSVSAAKAPRAFSAQDL